MAFRSDSGLVSENRLGHNGHTDRVEIEYPGPRETLLGVPNETAEVLYQRRVR